MGNKVDVFKISLDAKKGDCCPECNANWDGGDILEWYKNVRENETHELHQYYKNKSDEELIEEVSSFGWTKETPKRFSLVIGVELSYTDPEHYDGISYYMCPECNVAWNRWDGKRSEKFVKPIEDQKLGERILHENQSAADAERNNKKDKDMSD